MQTSKSGVKVDRTGAAHVNKKTGEVIDTPHVHDKKVEGGIRKAIPGKDFPDN